MIMMMSALTIKRSAYIFGRPRLRGGGTVGPGILSTSRTSVTRIGSGCTIQSLPQYERLATEILRRQPRFGYAEARFTYFEFKRRVHSPQLAALLMGLPIGDPSDKLGR
jgi:hypothetical protein